MAHTQNRHELRGGRLIVYKRDDVLDGIWQCRIRIPGLKRYVRKSTSTKDLDDAKRFADDLYAVTLHKQQNDIPVFTKTFNEVADELLRKAKQGRRSKGRVELIRGTLERYMRGYYGRKAIDMITAKDIAGYEDYRLAYWKNVSDDKRPANAKDRPSDKTLQMEQTVLRLVFKTAVAMGVIAPTQIPYMETVATKTNRRPAFTLKEFKRLMEVAERQISETTHPRVKRERQLLWGYIRFMAHSGLRIGEARYLRFCDMEYFDDANDEEYANKNAPPRWLRIWVDGKTGKREVSAHEEIRPSVYYLHQLAKEALEARGEYTEGFNIWESELYVFGRADGTPTKTFEVGFKRLLEKADLRYGSDKTSARTVYSLRHSYATFRIQYDQTDIYVLAKNMGTSVAMIEKHYGHIKTTDMARQLSKNAQFIEKG